MKAFLFFLLGVIHVSLLYGQVPRHDNIWINADISGAATIDFSSGSPVVESLDIPWVLHGGSAMISNAEGDLQFYTNGCFVFNHEHQIMDNGEGINPGVVHDDYCDPSVEYPWGFPAPPQSTYIVPWPSRPDEYIMIHIDIEYVVDPVNYPGDSGAKFMYFTHVDMRENGGLGRVIEKNVVIDTVVREPRLALVRHGNGLDWWVVNPIANSKEIRYYLITERGIRYTGNDFIGTVDGRNTLAADQYTFTPQGDKLLRFSIQEGLSIFDFDRTTGRLSNFDHIPFPQGSPNEWGFSGLGISPSGQYAYVGHVLNLYQYDLWAEDIQTTQTHIATLENPDGLFLPPTGELLQLGPDCKLYWFNNSGVAHHVIHQPDEPGEACQFEQDGLQLTTWMFRDKPTFPNFRLGPLGDEGSPCAGPIVSLSQQPMPVLKYLAVYPNPALGGGQLSLSLNARFPELSGRWSLRDTRGRTVFQRDLRTGTVTEAVLPEVAAGVYFWELRGGGEVVDRGKMIVR